MKKLLAHDLKQALKSATFAMLNNSDRIDEMNVFPVPDGDTGSNMSGTLKSAWESIADLDFDSVGELMTKFARGALMGARGNSGVILSQFFKGFAIGLEGKKEAMGADIVESFIQSKEYAYKSVMTPVEGTILTLTRFIQEQLKSKVSDSSTIINVFEEALKISRVACDITPSLLPVLKEVGVNDSGAEGLHLIIEGMILSLKGKPVVFVEQKGVKKNIFENDEVFDGEFGYCTEYIVELKNHTKFDKEKYQEALKKIGNSIVVVQDDDILKTHVHTITPGNAFNLAQKYGEFITLKSENMTLQANESKGRRKSKSDDSNKNTSAAISVIACNNGNGIIKEMKELGTAFVIEGGQSNNPSMKDFIDAIDKVKSNKIIILPNNSNIILLAQQVIQTVSDKEIIIIPTRTQVEGLVAMLSFDDSNSLDDNKELMEESVDSVKTGLVTTSIKDTKIANVKVREGEYLAIADKKILASTKSKVKSAQLIVDKYVDSLSELVTIWYGEDATIVDAKELQSYIESKYDVDVEIKNGAQKIYHFLISFE